MKQMKAKAKAYGQALLTPQNAVSPARIISHHVIEVRQRLSAQA